MTLKEKSSMSLKQSPVFSVKTEDSRFTVYRGSTPLQTPKNLSVTVPTQRLADALVQECVGQGERLDLRQMPLMQMTLTSIDITAFKRDEIIASILRYGETELLCQRAAEPDDLIREHYRVWHPYLTWCKEKFGADFQVGAGIAPVAQKPETLNALRVVVQGFETYTLTGLSEAVGISGSLVLGLALATGHADSQAIFAAAELDSFD